MRAWSDFYPDVLPFVMGCPEPVLEHHLRRAAQEFFSSCHVWTRWLANITTTTAQDYPLNLEPLSELVKLQRATLAGRQVGITTPDALPADWQTYKQGIKDCIFTRDRKVISLITANPIGQLLRIEAVLKPSNAATGVQDEFYDQYADAIAMGAKARIKKMTGTTYYDPIEALALEASFKQAMATIGFAKFRGFSSSLPRARIRTF